MMLEGRKCDGFLDSLGRNSSVSGENAIEERRSNFQNRTASTLASGRRLSLIEAIAVDPMQFVRSSLQYGTTDCVLLCGNTLQGLEDELAPRSYSHYSASSSFAAEFNAARHVSAPCLDTSSPTLSSMIPTEALGHFQDSKQPSDDDFHMGYVDLRSHIVSGVATLQHSLETTLDSALEVCDDRATTMENFNEAGEECDEHFDFQRQSAAPKQ